MARMMPRSDVIHLGLLLAALALSYVLPFELLLLSYAILGPVHYLTQISWLHERRYFLPWRWVVLPLIALSVVAINVGTLKLSGLMIWSTFLIGLVAVAQVSLPQRIALAAVAAGLTAALFTQD